MKTYSLGKPVEIGEMHGVERMLCACRLCVNCDQARSVDCIDGVNEVLAQSWGHVRNDQCQQVIITIIDFEDFSKVLWLDGKRNKRRYGTHQ